MVFSSSIFLFFFLPITLFFIFVLPKRLQNVVLLIASLLFYSWGEGFYVLLMLFSIAANYIFGLLLSWAKQKKTVLSLGILVNLGLLFYFKYANFIIDNVNRLLAFFGSSSIVLDPVHLPIGISFFTFQSLTYLVDIYRGIVRAEKNPLHVGLYISLFPQLIAGPIVRYHDIAKQIQERHVQWDSFSIGVKRFMIGLAKKLLIANTLGSVADKIFALNSGELTPIISWLGVICYTFQIYYDFSGYSDMAIGLGRMFGFHFLENFNFPYMAQSIREFWRRWHISLSNWFRDYLYIPLGGNRLGQAKTYCNLLIVFFLTGLWHGAAWNFVFWGLFHGFFLVLERCGFEKILAKTPRLFRQAYMLLVVMVGWVFFRAESFHHAFEYLTIMFSFNAEGDSFLFLNMYMNREVILALSFASLGLLPILPWLQEKCTAISHRNKTFDVFQTLMVSTHLLLAFFLSLLYLVSSTYNPFIYFRF